MLNKMMISHIFISVSLILLSLTVTTIDGFGLHVTKPGAKILFSRSFSLSPLYASKDEIPLMERIDRAGRNLKPLALEAKEESSSIGEDEKKKRILTALKSCAFFSLFMVYRAYRGFFVIIPSVFQLTYQRLTEAVETPFEDKEMATIDPDSNVSPYTGKARKRYRITVAVLSSIVVVSYILMGLFKVFTKFLSTMNKTGSMVGSFEAAADELDLNETKLAKATKGKHISK